MIENIKKVAGSVGDAAYNASVGASVGAGVAVVSGYLAGSMGHNVPSFSKSLESLQANLKGFFTWENWTFSNVGTEIGNMFGRILQLPFFLVGAAIGGLANLVVKAGNCKNMVMKGSLSLDDDEKYTADPSKVSEPVDDCDNPINHKVGEAYQAAYELVGAKASAACASVIGLFCKPAADSGDQVSDNKSQEGLTHTN